MSELRELQRDELITFLREESAWSKVVRARIADETITLVFGDDERFTDALDFSRETMQDAANKLGKTVDEVFAALKERTLPFLVESE